MKKKKSYGLLIDFGSTFTKLVAIDVNSETVVADTQAPTTVETDITIGYQGALAKLEGISEDDFEFKLACSSAAGGLRMIAIGLVPDFTVEAAKRAALGAGAKVLKTFSYKLTSKEIEEIINISPDIILLTGGTDGGDRETIVHNAEALAHANIVSPIIVAGNKEARDEIERILSEHNKESKITDNVLPELGRLNIEPVKEVIRQLFMKNIIYAKGIAEVEGMIDDILMPTPTAVLKAVQLLADGVGEEKGIGELLTVDLGGATTDVHSIAKGKPTKTKVIKRGLPDPYAQRTVEGDLGLRVSAPTLLEAAGEEMILAKSGLKELSFDLRDYVEQLTDEVGMIPTDPEKIAIDLGMSKSAVKLAVDRHVGTLEEISAETGTIFIQRGKDLSDIEYVIGTGGIFAHSEESARILEEAIASEDEPWLLKPKTAKLLIDKRYILWAMGLLSTIYPLSALRMMKKYVEKL